MKTAFTFPAFITEFTYKELDFLSKYSVDLNDYLKQISDSIQIDLPDFNYKSEHYSSNELYSQLLQYAFSCAFNDILNKEGIKPDVIAGYSMGIYASLHASGCVSFKDGAKLIYNAFQLVKDIAQTKQYAMGAVIGLSLTDIEYIVKKTIRNKIFQYGTYEKYVIAAESSKMILESVKDGTNTDLVEAANSILINMMYEKILSIDSIDFKDDAAMAEEIRTF